MEFTKRKRIGQGGFGTVDLVIMDDGTKCALKTFSPNQPFSSEELETVKKRFVREIEYQSAINHPNIVPILHSDLKADPPYYLMPLAESSLNDDIARDKTLGGNFVSVLSNIVAALEELHSMEIFHRDLKPQNVLRFSHEGTPVYAISDFGLISTRESNISRLTVSGMGKSSDFYTAPEIANDLRKASAQSDIYSLGCILHDIIGQEDRVPFREIKESSVFGPILAGCTKDTPSKRFASVRAILDAILTMEFNPTGEISEDSEGFLAMLTAEHPPEKNDWIQLTDYIENNLQSADIAVIYGKMTVDKIENLCKVDANCAKKIGLFFAEWVSDTSFQFELCDAIANRLEIFYMNGDLETKVACLLALLKMGTSHNRWYVEDKFTQLCGPGMDENLAKRLIVQFHIEGKEKVCRMISHLESSINFNRENFHNKLIEGLEKLCV